MRAEALSKQTISISTDCLAIRDQTDDKQVHLFDTSTGKPLNDGKPFTHKHEIVEIALDQTGLPNERKLAIVDKNRDLHLTNVRKFGKSNTTGKLGAMIQSLCWSQDCNMLVAVQDSKVTVWFYPNIIFVDRNLLNRTLLEKDSSEFGKHAVVVSFVNNSIGVRRADGSLVATGVPPYPAILHQYVRSGHWENATKICRFVKETILWACLAGMAVTAKQLNTAEIAYTNLQEADKVYYIQYIRELPLKEVRAAEMSVLSGNYQDAESTLLQSGLIFRAILLNIYLHNWERGLDLAVKHRTHVDTVLAYRLKLIGKR